MPDIDMDFCERRRGEVIDYVKRKYGEDHVAQIVTFNTLKAKNAVRNVSKALSLTFAEENALAKEFSQWIDAGLMGVEIYHPSMSPAYRLKWKQIANQYHLMITGGSDFHAPGDKHADIGEMIDAWNTCNEDVERLMEAVQMVKGN